MHAIRLLKKHGMKTPDGYIPAISVQPVRNEPNIPLVELPTYGQLPGMWAEVTVPFVDIYLMRQRPEISKVERNG